MERLLLPALLLLPTVAEAASRHPAETGGYALAAGLAVVAVVLIGVGVVLGLLRKMVALAKLIVFLGVLTVVVAIGSAAALIFFF